MLFSFWKKNKENRPWGSFEILSKDTAFLIKKITVKPEKRLSYQSHTKRNEHWFIIKGNGKIILNDSTFEIKAGSSFDIPVNAKHRIENTDKVTDLVFIEISTGLFDENDILRYEDDFGRVWK